MKTLTTSIARFLTLTILTLTLLACGGGGGGNGGNGTEEPTDPPPPPPSPPQEPITATEAARFLSQATFGPNSAAIEAVVASSAEDWFRAELEKPASLHLDDVLSFFPPDGSFRDEQGMLMPELVFRASDSFWQKAVEGDDQLRQRMAYALSQILVISAEGTLDGAPQTVAAYMDILTQGAFGNYRDLLEEVTYSPAMAVYLTYLRNQKADPVTGRVPDENYARELLQLFTIGLLQLNPDGTPTLDDQGQSIELYDNTDITGLAKVFTGLNFPGTAFDSSLRFVPLEAYYQQLVVFDAFHSDEEKNFLGTNIAAGTGGEATLDQALDTIFGHPNVGPFLARQLIQRFVTSAPTPNYVARVVAAFDAGDFTLPDGSSVGNGARGDLSATLAAILFDDEARSAASTENIAFGKLREPVIRFTHWARAFEVNSADASNETILRYTGGSDALGQHPYRSSSVFNFYRPGYIAPGTATGNAGLTAPELQIANATTVVGYPNFMTLFAFGLTPQRDRQISQAFIPSYSTEIALADDSDALLDHLDLLLTHGNLQTDTRARIAEVLDFLPPDSDENRQLRAQFASFMIMTAPEYIVLR
ncbi:MAG: hypothetical protein ACI9NT_000281 [Bacteroidia bacterium]|jgi:uncharacterized protein (DUF1800 family)